MNATTQKTASDSQAMLFNSASWDIEDLSDQEQTQECLGHTSNRGV
jgi:hypothetical protein